MKKFLRLLSGIGAAVALCSCGSLTQHVGGDRLSPETLQFAHQMREEPSWSTMGKTYDGVYHETDQWYAEVIPFIIFWNWTALGNFDHDKTFVVRKVSIFFPAYYAISDSRYNANGLRVESGLEWNLALVIGYENFHTHAGDGWKNGILWIPAVGPCIGWGSNYFQFLWIPFSELN